MVVGVEVVASGGYGAEGHSGGVSCSDGERRGAGGGAGDVFSTQLASGENAGVMNRGPEQWLTKEGDSAHAATLFSTSSVADG